jgi:hypothetical protein
VARYLDSRFDPGLAVDLADTPDSLAGQEIDRLQSKCAVVSVAGQIPRRIGKASGEELALDKLRCRRVLHVCRQSLKSWGGEERLPSDEEQIAGAQLLWEEWTSAYASEVETRIRYFATWGKRAGEIKVAKSAVVRLEQELRWLRYALRD